ncbi:MAG: hypothetical protein J6S14_19775 [Clostridia bacterium]|nr:hypothetical protein [Clostridia bacterium]
MKCIDCPAFKVAYEPIKADNGYWDLGRAVCEKHNLITDFATRRKLNSLECWEKSTEDKEGEG